MLISQNKNELKDIKLADKIYDILIRRSILENKKIGTQYNKALDCGELYQEQNIDYDEERTLQIRRVSFPTYLLENRQFYYDIFLVHIPCWRIGELKQINQMILDTRTNHYISDSRNIFITGCLSGHIEQKHTYRYRICVFNVEEIGVKQWSIFFKILHNYLDVRSMNMSKGGKTFSHIEKDSQRISKLAEFFLDMSKINTSILSINVNSMLMESINKRPFNVNRKDMGVCQ